MFSDDSISEDCYSILDQVLGADTERVQLNTENFEVKMKHLEFLITKKIADGEEIGGVAQSCMWALDELRMAIFGQEKRLKQIEQLQVQNFKQNVYWLGVELEKKKNVVRRVIGTISKLFRKPKVAPVPLVALFHSPILTPVPTALHMRILNCQVELGICLDTMIYFARCFNLDNPTALMALQLVWEKMDNAMFRMKIALEERNEHVEAEIERQNGFAERHME